MNENASSWTVEGEEPGDRRIAVAISAPSCQLARGKLA
jgi:hypothetical protein